jgi:peptide/nickel transport system substrate-binding protein
MKLRHLLYEAPAGRMLLAALAILLALGAGHANAASEPGTVTIVLNAEPSNMDPGNTSISNVGKVLLKNIAEPLTEINLADSSIMPRLATSWKQIDANTWHFVLRKGVKFHDGADFNAEAVIFNMKRMYDTRLGNRTRDKVFSNLKVETKALDNYTVEFKTNKLEPLMPTLMADLAICSPNSPQDKWTRNPIGTGPYRFVKWDAGTQIILERFDGYWGKQPQVKKAVYVWRSESSVRAAMAAVGEADLVPEIAPQDATQPDMDISYLNSETTQVIITGAWLPPLNDIRVRKALNYAVDRNAIRGSILSKDAIPASQLNLPNIFGYNPDLKPWPYDPPKAKQLLDEARKDGVPVDKEILLVARIGLYPNNQEVCEALASMYKAVGLNVKVKMVETAVHIRYRDKPRPTDVGPYLVENSTDNSKGDALFVVYPHYHCQGQNPVICDKKLDDLIEKAQVAQGEERRKLWQAAAKRVEEEVVPDVVLFHMIGYCRVGKRINFKPSIVTTNEIQLAQITFR